MVIRGIAFLLGKGKGKRGNAVYFLHNILKNINYYEKCGYKSG
jgi:hypothetical protein